MRTALGINVSPYLPIQNTYFLRPMVSIYTDQGEEDMSPVMKRVGMYIMWHQIVNT